MPASKERRSIWFIVHALSALVGVVGWVVTQALGMRAYAVPCGALFALSGVAGVFAGATLFRLGRGVQLVPSEDMDAAVLKNPWVVGGLSVVIGLALAYYGLPALTRGAP